MRYSFCAGGLRKCLFVLLMLILSQESTASTATPLKLMSFNVRFDAGAPSSNANAWISTTGNHRRDLAFNVINDVSPDILGVQEALNNQVQDLKGELNGYSFYGVGRDDGVAAGEYSGIFYRSNRFTQTQQGTFWLNENPDTPGTKFPGTCCARLASWVVLQDHQAENQEYFVLNTHWDHQNQAAREFSAQLIRDRIDLVSGNRPVIVMGDLNTTPENAAYLNLIGTNDPNEFQLIDSYREVFPEPTSTEATFHGYVGNIIGLRVDYILHSNYFHAEQANINRAVSGSSYPSDHYPVTATLRPRLSGDFDFDGDVDGIDFLNWQRGETLNSLNTSDLANWKSNLGTITQQTAVPATTIPEPATWYLLLMCLVATLGRGM